MRSLYPTGTYLDRVAVASIHGANLATDRPDSPHLLAETPVSDFS